MKIAILTAGGVAPGMNAVIRAASQAALHEGWEVLGVEGGYGGLLAGRLNPVDSDRLGALMRRGGTMLGSDRSKEVTTEQGRERAAQRLQEAGVDGLIVIGGGGSLAGAMAMGEVGVAAVGVPATIDNDIPGTELAVGTDTAVHTAVQAMDSIRGTAISHNRAHIVKVMGRDSGYLALMSAIAGGAEAVVVPEFETRPKDLVRAIEAAYEGGKSHFIVVAAEGAEPSAEDLQGYVNEASEAGETYDADLTAVGHMQSGGDPTSSDRILAARLGATAFRALADGEAATMVAMKGEKTERVPLKQVVGEERPLDPDMYELAGVLSRTFD